MNQYEPGDFVYFEPLIYAHKSAIKSPVKCQVNSVRPFANSSCLGLTAFLDSGIRIRFTAFAHQLRPYRNAAQVAQTPD